MWSLAFVTWMIDLSLFLDAPILKLRIIIIILPTDQLEINLLIVPTTINKVTFALGLKEAFL